MADRHAASGTRSFYKPVRTSTLRRKTLRTDKLEQDPKTTGSDDEDLVLFALQGTQFGGYRRVLVLHVLRVRHYTNGALL
jgi:hypothetical protein